MKSATLKQFWDCFDGLPADVQELARNAFALWQEDPWHGSLHFKRIHSREPFYSVRVGRSWRALGLLNGQTIVWFWVGSHADYDHLIRRL